jgi:hypothetical protein
MRRSFTATLAIAALLGFAAPTSAQQVEWTRGDEDRSTVMQFLERDDVSGAVERIGADPQDLGRAVLDMSDEDASRVARDVRVFEQAYAADTITMTTTTLIIILLLVILLILVVD